MLKINWIIDLFNGWKIELSENGKEYYEKMKKKHFLKVGVEWVRNKGKSFLLQKLEELPNGKSINNEGSSTKYSNINSENKNIIFLDSVGSETYFLEDANFDFNKFKDIPNELKTNLKIWLQIKF